MLSEGRIVGNGDVRNVQYGDDSGWFVEFYSNEVQSAQKSEEAGRPIFESRDYIRMVPVGDSTKKIDRPVRKEPYGGAPADTERFPKQWQAYKNQEIQVVEGTPVTEWPPITRADAMSLKAMDIHTVEQLANLGENNLTWLGARKMRDMAKNWVDKAAENADAAKWAEEKENLQSQITALQNQIKGISQEADAPPVKSKKKQVKNEQNVSKTDSASG